MLTGSTVYPTSADVPPLGRAAAQAGAQGID
jgi:hypothetical protein